MSSNGVEQGEEVKIVEPLKENGYPSSFVHRESGPSRPTQGLLLIRGHQEPLSPYCISVHGVSATIRRFLYDWKSRLCSIH